MTVPTLFDLEQQPQLEHVSGAIAQLILGFVRGRLRSGQTEFHASELHEHIARHTEGFSAPASADRILRDLRRKGLVRYVVVNRRASLYRVF